MSKSLIVLGAGGHASVLVDALKGQDRKILAIVSSEKSIEREVFSGIEHLKNDQDVFEFNTEDVVLVNGVGSLPGCKLRQNLARKFIDRGYTFESVISKDAVVSKFAKIGQGVQIMSGAVIQAGAKIGGHSIINTGATVDHDCTIGAYNHIAPGVTLSGEVCTGDFVHIGTGAKIIQCISIGRNSVIGSGTVIFRPVPPNSKVLPNKPIIQIEAEE